MTIRHALNTASQQLKSIDSGNLVAERLLTYVLAKPATFVWAHPEFEVPSVQAAKLNDLTARASQHEPLAYLTGMVEFYGRQFKVTPDTLIPRPETEQLVNTVVEFIRSLPLPSPLRPANQPLRIVDVGTGSGCIAITLASQLPQAQVYAIDVSSKALNVARSNAARHGVSNCVFLNGCLLEPLQGLLRPHAVTAIAANLPYISDEEFDTLPSNVRNFEPAVALKSGSHDPDYLNKQLVAQAPYWLAPDGLLAYETTNGRVVDSRE